MPSETTLERINREHRLRMTPEALAAFAALGEKPGAERLMRVADWIAGVNVQNHDGVTITPALARHLALASDLPAAISKLDDLRARTRRGRFDLDNELMRELEYHRFASECNRQRDWTDDANEQRALFNTLEALDDPRDDPIELSHQDAREAGRAAYEAIQLLRFLRSFKAGTSRPIVVFGNERYGRDWVVQPLEPYLRHDFDIRYWRVQSHSSMRLTVPHWVGRWNRSGFPPDFWVELSEAQPHVVVVDECSPRMTERYSKFARGVRDLLNWFMLFNDLRSQGDGAAYERESGLPYHHFPELRKWHEYEVAKRELRHYVRAGDVYRVRHWAPKLREDVIMGGMVVPARPPVFGDDAPTVILANPAIYQTEGRDLPEQLRGTSPYYFNDPEYRIRHRVIPGFGAHGFETRIEGPTTDEYVIAARTEIERRIAEQLREGKA